MGCMCCAVIPLFPCLYYDAEYLSALAIAGHIYEGYVAVVTIEGFPALVPRFSPRSQENEEPGAFGPHVHWPQGESSILRLL